MSIISFRMPSNVWKWQGLAVSTCRSLWPCSLFELTVENNASPLPSFFSTAISYKFSSWSTCFLYLSVAAFRVVTSNGIWSDRSVLTVKFVDYLRMSSFLPLNFQYIWPIFIKWSIFSLTEFCERMGFRAFANSLVQFLIGIFHNSTLFKQIWTFASKLHCLVFAFSFTVTSFSGIIVTSKFCSFWNGVWAFCLMHSTNQLWLYFWHHLSLPYFYRPLAFYVPLSLLLLSRPSNCSRKNLRTVLARSLSPLIFSSFSTLFFK